jgi:alpha-beta hydrolase superfamily lysophospholipase
LADSDHKTRVAIEIIDGAGGYPLSVRVWRPERGPRARIIILHGIVSHSHWLTPIAEVLVANDIEVICPDRRGAGLNTDAPGDTPSAAALVNDVSCIADHYDTSTVPLHLAGFCWGFNYAINCAEKIYGRFQSLIAIAPTLFPARDIADSEVRTGESSDATETPLVPIDRFTSGPSYEEFIVPDPHRTQAVSRRFNSVMMQMNSMIAVRWIKLKSANLTILASNDRLADNDKHRIAYAKLRATPKRLFVATGEHGLQFDAAQSTATEITNWLSMDAFHLKK